MAAFNERITNRAEIFAAYDDVLAALADTTDLDKAAAELTQECEIVMELTRRAVQENASAALDQAAYQERYDALVARYETAHARLGEIEKARSERRAKRASIKWFLRTLQKQDDLVEEFDEELWYTTVERLEAFQDGRLCVVFRDGGEVEIAREQRKVA